MRGFFENLQLNFYLPRLNFIQDFLDSVNKSRTLASSVSAPEHLPGLSKFSEKLEENSRSIILQGELVWLIVILERSKSVQQELNLKDPRIAKVLPTLKFSINFSKHDINSNSEKVIPLNARFLESQVFIDEKEQTILQETDNNTGEEAPMFFEIDYEKTQIAYLLKIPIAIHQEYLDTHLNMKVSLISPMEQVRNVGEAEDATFGGILTKIYETLNANKDKKPYVLFQVKTNKVTNIFDCQSSINSFGKKLFITLKVKNRLNEILYTEGQNSNNDYKGKLQLYIENVDFLLQNSVSKAQLDKADREKIAAEVNEAFNYKILSGKMPIVLDEDSEFNLIIQVEKEKLSARSDNKYLVYQCEECKKKALPPPENSFLVYTEKIDDVEKAPKTPTDNPFTNRNESLSFKEILGTERSPSPERSSPTPTTTRSKFDFSFFQSPLNYDTKSYKAGMTSVDSYASPKKAYPTNIKNIVTEKRKSVALSKAPKLPEPQKVENLTCKCFTLLDSGCSVYMSTPLVIKWSINHLFFTSSIYRIVWNFKDMEIINAVCRVASHYYKVGDTIEIEVEVENKTLNDIELELVPPSEVLQNLAYQDLNENVNMMMPQEDQNENFSLKKMEKVMQTKISNDQLMAIATEKSIPYGLLKSNEKQKMKMNLLALNHGMVRLDYLVFYDQRRNVYLKVYVPISFTVS